MTGPRPAVSGLGAELPPHSGAPAAKTAKPAKAPASAKAQAPSKPAVKERTLHSNAPRWASRAAMAVAILAIAAWGAKWLLDTPSDIIQPAQTQADVAPPLPDAAAAPSGTEAPALVSAPPVEAPAEPLGATAPVPGETPALAGAPAVATTDSPLDNVPVIDDKPAVAETASYRLAIKPWGTVYVDGKEKGVSPPLKRLMLPAGKHKVRIVNPNFRDHFVDVNVAAGKSGTIEVDFAANSK